MKHMAEAVMYISLIIAILLCLGEPDVLDGLIKRANGCQHTTLSNVDHTEGK